MFANLFQSRLKHMHTHVPQRDSESLDSDTLLPSDPLTASLSLTANAVDRSSRDIRVAVKTLLLSTVVYLGVGLWLAYGARNAAFVTNVDDFCMRHISRYSPVVKNVIRVWAEANQLPPEDQVNMSRFYEMPKPGTSVLTEIP
ncbi:hypothetical protein HBI37_002120 [Parastagonospora nodorum]|nr:hypothetical protein HBI37_002120 [Parastagonospora nodorum]KAH6369979.1 hypothetical protein HBI36_029150 [Parastagonospora nodorum]